MTGPLALTVRFDLAPGRAEAFHAAACENAARSVAEEPGCLRFDVLRPLEGDGILLYEIYADRAAFDAHLDSEHYRRFDAATSPWVVAKEVRLFILREAAKAPA